MSGYGSTGDQDCMSSSPPSPSVSDDSCTSCCIDFEMPIPFYNSPGFEPVPPEEASTIAFSDIEQESMPDILAVSLKVKLKLTVTMRWPSCQTFLSLTIYETTSNESFSKDFGTQQVFKPIEYLLGLA